MPVNLLTQRLKAAKRELTNLKTAHKRGLGLLETYRWTGETDYESGMETLTFVIDFSQEYAAYPFFQILPYLGAIISSTYDFGGISATYSNNGYRATVSLPEKLGFFYTSFYIVSLSPVTNVSWSWS